MLIFAVLAYAGAMLLANLIVAGFAARSPHLLPIVTAVNAFMLIGLDLSLRDALHVRLRWPSMAALIVCTGALTYLLNPAAGQIAAASATAFLAAAIVDWALFASLTRASWLARSNVSNVASAAVDSVAFPVLAGWGLDWSIVGSMFAAKVLGGAAWAAVIDQALKRTRAAETAN